MKVWIDTHLGPTLYDIPFHVKSITFEQFCDFKQLKATLFDSDNDFEPEKLAKLLSVMVKGDLSLIPISNDEDMQELISSKYQIELGNNISLFSLYAHIINLIQLYTPESIPDELKFDFLGHTFEVKKRKVVSLMTNKPLTTGEAIECLEYQRVAKGIIDQTPKEVGNIEFNLGLSEFSILVRKPGETLPVTRAKRESWIDERKKLIRNLTLDLVLDARFFFINALVTYKMTPGSNFSGKALRLQKQKKPKRIKAGK